MPEVPPGAHMPMHVGRWLEVIEQNWTLVLIAFAV